MGLLVPRPTASGAWRSHAVINSVMAMPTNWTHRARTVRFSQQPRSRARVRNGLQDGAQRRSPVRTLPRESSCLPHAFSAL